MQATRQWTWGKGNRGSGYGGIRDTDFFWKVPCRVEARRYGDLTFFLIKSPSLVLLDYGTWTVVFLQFGVVSTWELS